MEHLLIQTSGGPLGFVGRLHTDQVRPSLLVVTGSFPPDGYLHGLVNHFAGANVLVASMPGMWKVPWANEPSVAGATKGLEDAVRRLLPDGPIVAFGSSTGNIRSLALRLPNIFRRVADEPFFQTRDLWPFIGNSRDRMKLKPGAAPLARYLWEYFGIGPDRLENRDYGRLLENITVPTDVLVDQSPLLPERDLPIWPSFTSAQDRE
jgi:hypothetical protein